MQPVAGQEHEVNTFALFTQSFDTLSDPGNYFRECADNELQNENSNCSSPSDSHGRGRSGRDRPPRKIDFTMKDHENGSFNGDISPIKLDDNSRTDPSPNFEKQHIDKGYQPLEHRFRKEQPNSRYYDVNSAPHNPIYAPPPSPHRYGYEPGHRPQYGNSLSNPFYVLRSVHKAFGGCSYLLPCLRDRDICPVNLSQHTSIHQYHEQVCSHFYSCLLVKRSVLTTLLY